MAYSETYERIAVSIIFMIALFVLFVMIVRIISEWSS